jgi:low temperature requirement protein LtrA
MQIALFMIAARDDPELRHSVVGLGISTGVGVGLLIGASFFDGAAQAAFWVAAIALDMGGPLVIDPSGWRLVPGHFAERHGLILLIALGESIVAIGVGVGGALSFGQGVAAVVGVGLAAGLWWLYFDVGALTAARRLERAEPGRTQNTLARDSYSWMHFPMIAGVVLVALGLKKTLGDVDHELKVEAAAALLGGTALYLLAFVAFRYRHVRTVNARRVAVALLLLALVPVATQVSALATLAGVTAAVWALIAIETRSYGEGRGRVRHGDTAPPLRTRR